MNQFHYIFYAQEVIFGSGSIAALAEAAERFYWRRLMLCTTKNFRSRGFVTSIEEALGERLAVVFENVQPHVPYAQVEAALALAAENKIDAIIGLGGGSAIGIAKAVSQALEEKITGRSARTACPTDQPLIPVIAIPTTYAGSEMTPVYGITHYSGNTPQKKTITYAKITPKFVIYDPMLTLDLPPWVTAGTGINATGHCIEALYSITRNPMSTSSALGGLRSIGRSLPQCYLDGTCIEARSEMLAGSFLAGVALSNVKMGLHHGVCHVLGGSTGVSHGDVNSVMLPHVMRFNLDETAPQLALVSEAMGLRVIRKNDMVAAEAAIEHIEALIAQMELPRRLRDLGLKEAELPKLAQMAFESPTVQNNPKSLKDVSELQKLLQDAW